MTDKQRDVAANWGDAIADPAAVPHQVQSRPPAEPLGDLIVSY